jgi:hypothetical protein
MEMLGVVLVVIAIGVLGWTAADWFLSLPLRPSHSPHPRPHLL